MKKCIALYAFICVFMLPVYAMEEGSGSLVEHNYFDYQPDDVLRNIEHQLVGDCNKTPLLKNYESFRSTCKRFYRIAQERFINQDKALDKLVEKYKNVPTSKIYFAADLNFAIWINQVLKDPKNAGMIRERNQYAIVEANLSSWQSPLHIAAKQGALDIARLLIKMGARIDAMDVKKRMPLHYALENNRLEMVKLFIDLGMDVDKDKPYRPLRCAVGLNNPPMVKLLLDKGVNADFIVCNSTSLLDFAKQQGNQEIITMIEQALAKRGL